MSTKIHTHTPRSTNTASFARKDSFFFLSFLPFNTNFSSATFWSFCATEQFHREIRPAEAVFTTHTHTEPIWFQRWALLDDGPNPWSPEEGSFRRLLLFNMAFPFSDTFGRTALWQPRIGSGWGNNTHAHKHTHTHAICVTEAYLSKRNF